jgi:hypothetical protein
MEICREYPQSMKIKIAEVLEFVSLFILVWIAFILLFTSILYFFKIPVTAWNIIVPSIELLVLISGSAIIRRSMHPYLSGGILLVFIMASVFMLAGSIYDTSWDGLDYQQKAVIQLSNGLNPIYAEAEPQDVYYNMWLNHYPKAPWMFAAGMYTLTGQIETGKGLNLLLLVASYLFWVAIGLRTREFPVLLSLIFAFLIAFNPVSIYQSLNFYVDGLVSSSIVLLIGLMISIYREVTLIKIFGLGSIIILGLNIKFTGSAYITVFSITLFMGLWLSKKKIKTTKLVFGTLALAALLGILAVGYNPYVKNTLYYGNPFYPVYGSDSYNQKYILGGAGLTDFITQGGVRKLILATFSKTTNAFVFDNSLLKIPFQIDGSEFTALSAADIRLGGLGPWFSGALILSISGLLMAYFFDWRKAFAATLLLGLISGSMVIGSEYWWARYAPQFWLVPVTISILLVSLKTKPAKILGGLIAFTLLVNVGMISVNYYARTIHNSSEIKLTLAEMQASGKHYQIYLEPFTPWRIRLEQYNIPFIEVQADEMTAPLGLNLIKYQPIE